MNLVVHGGHVVMPDGVRRADVLVEEGTVEALFRGGSPTAGRTLDATGCLVFPGLVDTHVHMGFSTGEFLSTDDFASGSRAAAFGGVTTLIDYAFPARRQTLAEALRARRSAADGQCYVDFGLHVVLPPNRCDEARDIARCIELGVMSFKLFMIYPDLELGAGEVFERMALIAGEGGLALIHAEDSEFVDSRRRTLMAHGTLGPEGHFLSRPAVAEAMAVGRALLLQAETHCPLHFVHISSAAAIRLIREAKQQGSDVSWETCPQYLILDAEVYSRSQGHRYLVSPAIKTRNDQAALWLALTQGELDTVATDHCPFAADQKDLHAEDFTRVPTGLPGVETTLPLLFTEWQDRGLPLERLADLTSRVPARRFGLLPQKGSLAPGADADLVVYDPRTRGQVRAEDLHMNVDWNPYEGRRCTGSVRTVVSRGEVLIENGGWCGEKPQGKYVSRSAAAPSIHGGG